MCFIRFKFGPFKLKLEHCGSERELEKRKRPQLNGKKAKFLELYLYIVTSPEYISSVPVRPCNCYKRQTSSLHLDYRN